MLKRIGRSKPVQQMAGSLLAGYLRLVRGTSSLTCEPDGPYSHILDQLPFIATFWHGQHFMLPTTNVDGVKIKALISRHGDGEINAIAVQNFGFGLVRGAGDTRRKGPHKGGMTGYRNMLNSLADGYSICTTADVPKIARVAGLGVVTLGRDSGRPIVPMAFASSRRIDFDSWDKASLNLPFSRNAFVVADPIYIPSDTDDEGLESARVQIEDCLNRVTERAYLLAERRR